MKQSLQDRRQVFVVLRIDAQPGAPLEINSDIIATKAYWREEDAAREVERLNALNGPRGSVYVVTMARLQPPATG